MIASPTESNNLTANTLSKPHEKHHGNWNSFAINELKMSASFSSACAFILQPEAILLIESVEERSDFFWLEMAERTT